VEIPSQYSSLSHCPVEARQREEFEATVSLGQEPALPVQVSATSQTPLEARHSVPTVT
jgi:hypothetical protein